MDLMFRDEAPPFPHASLLGLNKEALLAMTCTWQRRKRRFWQLQKKARHFFSFHNIFLMCYTLGYYA